VQPLGRVKIPRTFNVRSPQSRRDLASSLRNLGLDETTRPGRTRSAAADDQEIARLRTAIRRHPVHGCDERDDHVRWAERYDRLAADTAKLRARVENRSSSIARAFDREVALLTDLGYVEDGDVTPAGRMLARVYSELDLVAVECVRAGVWGELAPAELAACVSTLVYESRTPDRDVEPPRLPGGNAREALGAMVRLWGQLSEAESQHGLSFLREPDLGFAWAAYRWAQGRPLDEVLTDADLSAGDFVRWVKQVVDLLGQLADVAAGSPLEKTIRTATKSLNRGIVAYSAVG
jgi:ATP-dependent RNA helicase HelY